MTVSFDGGSPVSAHVTIVPNSPFPPWFDAQSGARVSALTPSPSSPSTTTNRRKLGRRRSQRESLQVSVVNPASPSFRRLGCRYRQGRTRSPSIARLPCCHAGRVLERGDDYPALRAGVEPGHRPGEDYDSDPAGFSWLASATRDLRRRRPLHPSLRAATGNAWWRWIRSMPACSHRATPFLTAADGPQCPQRCRIRLEHPGSPGRPAGRRDRQRLRTERAEASLR